MRKPYQSPGRMKNSSYYIAPARDGTHDLPYTVASNMVKVIGVRANIHLGGQTEFCPNGFSGGGVVAEIFRDPYSVKWQNFFR